MAALSVCLLALSWPAASAHADPLSLDEAVAAGVAGHPVVEAAAHRAEAARATVAQAASAWYPRLTLDATYRYAGPVPTLTIETGINFPGAPSEISRELGTEHFASVGTTAGWRVYDFGSRGLRHEAARTMAQASELESEVEGARIAYAIRASYLALAFTHEVEAVTRRSLSTASQELADRRERLALGMGSELEVTAARARVAELELRLVDVTQERRIAEGNLRALLGLSPDQTLELTDDLATLAARAQPPQPVVAPAVRRLELVHDASTLNARALRRSSWPTLDVFATVDYRYPRNFAEADVAGINYAAGLALSWRLLDGGLVSAQADEAQARAAEAMAAREALMDEVGRQVSEARARWEAANERVAPAEAQMQAAADYLKAARGARDAGASSALDVVRAEERVELATLALSRARFDKAMAQAAWLMAQGLITTTAQDTAR